MSEPTPNYRGAFLSSPHHAWLGVLTLGLGFVTATGIGLLIGAGAYALGWIYLPDTGWFRGWVDRRLEAQRHAEEQSRVSAFVQQRDQLLADLTPSRREQYHALANVCRDIESATADSPLNIADKSADPRMHKIEELLWTYLRMLRVEQSLAKFLEAERRERVAESLKDAEREVASLTAEVESLRRTGFTAGADAKQRIIESKLERIEALRKRSERNDQTRANHALVVAEQERLAEQIKLIRADAVASKNAETMSARIDATVEQLDHTNRWIAQLDEFKELLGEFPGGTIRVGINLVQPPAAKSPPPASKESSSS
jgi:hypothetical protein